MTFPAATAVMVIGNVADFETTVAETTVAEAAEPWPPE